MFPGLIHTESSFHPQQRRLDCKYNRFAKSCNSGIRFYLRLECPDLQIYQKIPHDGPLLFQPVRYQYAWSNLPCIHANEPYAIGDLQ